MRKWSREFPNFQGISFWYFLLCERRTKYDGLPLSGSHGYSVLNVANGIAYYRGKYLFEGKFIDRYAL